MNYRCVLPYACMLLPLLFTATAWAQDPQTPSTDAAGAPAASPNFDEKTREIVDKTMDALQNASSLQFNANLSLNMALGEDKQEVSSAFRVAAEDPNKLSMVSEGGPMGMTLVSDGKDLYTYLPALSQYMVEPAPGAMQAILDQAGANPPALFILALTAENPREILLDGVTDGKYVGTETLDGVESHHMAFTHPELNWDLWVQTGEKPVIVRIKPDLGKALAQEVPEMKAEMIISYSNWVVGEDVPDDTFKFTPPEGAQLVSNDQEPPHALLGATAPEFQLDLLDGGSVKLSQHKGKDIVILDFWATWCGPCRRAMPIISNVAKEFQGRNVVLYAVNLSEEPDAIKSFLTDQGLDVKVALDKDGSVGQQYQAAAIPQTVIVDKDGKVQAVHVGIMPGLEDTLRQQLTALAEGKSLLDAKPAQ